MEGIRNIERALARWTVPAVDSGLATGGTNTTLNDTRKDWPIDQWALGHIHIIKANGAEYFRDITANTATQITFAALPGGVVVDTDDIYTVSDPKVLNLIKAQTDKIAALLGSIDLWSSFVASITISTTPTTQLLPSITIAGIPAGAALVRAVMLVKFRALSEDSGSDNGLDGDQEIQAQKAVGGSWLTGIYLVAGQLFCSLNSRDTGDVLVGAEDIKDQVPANGEVIDFQWLDSVALGDNLYIEDLQVGLRLWFNLP